MVFYNRSPNFCSNLQAISKKPTSLSTFWGNAGRVAAWQAISTAPAWCWAAFVALVAAGQAGVCSGWTSNDFSEEKLLVHEHAVGYVRLRVCWTFLSRWQRVWSVLCAVDVVYLIVAPSLAALSDVGFMVPGNLWTVPTFGPCRHFKTWSTSTVWLLSAAIVGTECGHLQRHRQCWCLLRLQVGLPHWMGFLGMSPFPGSQTVMARLGRTVPWCHGFPFNTGLRHPQYLGVVLTLFGALPLVMRLSENSRVTLIFIVC